MNSDRDIGRQHNKETHRSDRDCGRGCSRHDVVMRRHMEVTEVVEENAVDRALTEERHEGDTGRGHGRYCCV